MVPFCGVFNIRGMGLYPLSNPKYSSTKDVPYLLHPFVNYIHYDYIYIVHPYIYIINIPIYIISIASIFETIRFNSFRASDEDPSLRMSRIATPKGIAKAESKTIAVICHNGQFLFYLLGLRFFGGVTTPNIFFTHATLVG